MLNVKRCSWSAAAAAVVPFLVSAQGAPDLVGVRIGMTPEEALAALQARAPKEPWQTVRANLQFVSNNIMRGVENGGYRAMVRNKPLNNVAKQPIQYQVHLSPIPGKERVIAVRMSQHFYKEKPLAENVMKTLVEKYGEPAARQSNEYLWAFDAAGQPKAIKGDANEFRFCTASVPKEYSAPEEYMNFDPWAALYRPQGELRRQQASYAAICGETMVRAAFGGDKDGLVIAMDVEIVGHGAAAGLRATLDKIFADAEATDAARAREAAAKRAKPTL